MREIDELGPVDYLVVEFPAGRSTFTGEMADELLSLAGLRIPDLLVIHRELMPFSRPFAVRATSGRDYRIRVGASCGYWPS